MLGVGRDVGVGCVPCACAIFFFFPLGFTHDLGKFWKVVRCPGSREFAEGDRACLWGKQLRIRGRTRPAVDTLRRGVVKTLVHTWRRSVSRRRIREGCDPVQCEQKQRSQRGNFIRAQILPRIELPTSSPHGRLSSAGHSFTRAWGNGNRQHARSLQHAHGVAVRTERERATTWGSCETPLRRWYVLILHGHVLGISATRHRFESGHVLA